MPDPRVRSGGQSHFRRPKIWDSPQEGIVLTQLSVPGRTDYNGPKVAKRCAGQAMRM